MYTVIYNRVQKCLSTKRTFFRNRFPDNRLKIAFLVPLLVPVFVGFIWVILLPFVYPAHGFFQSENPSAQTHVLQQNTGNPSETVIDHQILRQLKELTHKEAFWNARMKLSGNDSISLCIDLQNNRLWLEVLGVKLRESEIKEAEIDNNFPYISQNSAFMQWLANPFILQQSYSTTEKTPVIIKKAPKDTIEANLNDTQPVAPEKDDVFYQLEFSGNLYIRISQSQPASFYGNIEHCFFTLSQVFSESLRTVGAVLRLEIPMHPLKIHLVLDREEARAIYRALPDNAAMAIQFPVYQ